jgi:hypothetical protein
MLSSTARAARSAAPNAVRLVITPQPANIAESREILRIVQRFGEVVTYKNLKVRLHARYSSGQIFICAFDSMTPSSAPPILH